MDAEVFSYEHPMNINVLETFNIDYEKRTNKYDCAKTGTFLYFVNF
jgi:hypothetical protein